MRLGKKTGPISLRRPGRMQEGTGSRLTTRLCLVLSIFAGLAVPALAATLNSIMSEMKQTTTAARNVLSNYDKAQADVLLHQYAIQALAAGKEIGGGAKGADLRKRFAALAATANNATSTDAAGFHTTFNAITAQCRSCHSAYK
jgi:hypothetical protein